MSLIFYSPSGMNFSHAVAAIQSLVGSVKGVQILYSERVNIIIKVHSVKWLLNTNLRTNQSSKMRIMFYSN